MNLKVSIIVPVYNNEKYLHICIESILNQIYKNIEIILINDGSTDQSGEICDEYAKVYNRVKVIHQENRGVSAARNVGLQHATGKYIQFADSDDFLSDKFTQTLVDFMQNHHCDNVVCGYNSITVNTSGALNTIKFSVEESVCDIRDFMANFYQYYENHLINSPCNKLYKRDLILKNGVVFDEAFCLGEDLIFNMQYLTNVKNVGIVSECLYYYVHTNENSLSNKYNSQIYDIQQNLYNEIRTFLMENGVYDKKNKEVIETDYIKTIINCIIAICSSNQIGLGETYKFIREVVNNNEVRNGIKSSKQLSNQKRFFSYLIRFRLVLAIIFSIQLKYKLILRDDKRS